MLANRVNLDFEKSLNQNDPTLIDYKITNKLEYIYFLFGENAPLYSMQSYSKSELQYYKDLLNTDAQVTSDGDHNNWWGDLSDFEKMRRINSKVDQTNWLIDEGLGIEGLKLVLNEERVFKQDMYYRAEYGFSGLSNRIIHKGEIKKLSKGVIAPLLENIISFGISFSGSEYFICLNTILDGRFLGGKIIRVKDLSVLVGIDESVLMGEIDRIIERIKKYTGYQWGQFDSLFYGNRGKYNWYKVVEINQRKTMGLVIKKCAELFGPGEFRVSSLENEKKEHIKLFVKENALKTYYVLD